MQKMTNTQAANALISLAAQAPLNRESSMVREEAISIIFRLAAAADEELRNKENDNNEVTEDGKA